jgi:hypothetical protein
MEDDIDWDVRFKHQLLDFALSARALMQPPSSERLRRTVYEVEFDSLQDTAAASRSPYGDDWDVLWIGHCGMHFPFADSEAIPKGRIIHRNDETVAEKRYLWTLNTPFTLVEEYDEHTRAVHHAQEGVCSLAYAISQRGAQRLLNEVALRTPTDGFDILLRFFCEGAKGRGPHTCLATQPSLFHHHRPVGPLSSESNINGHGDGYRDRAYTDMVRWSVRLNADAILAGVTEMHDQYPNGD